jgi:hypothetical protein
MRMALRRAGLALVAAGTLGIVLPAGAQAPSDLPGRLAGAPLAPGHGRLLEIGVELALMADPCTFPYRFGPHARGDRLELRGFVPDEVVHQRALTIATESSALPVLDALCVHPARAQASSEVPPDQLQSAAALALQEAFPEHGRRFAVRARGDGEVTVSGPVSSCEEKVAVSHCLRTVRGCTAVNNLLNVDTVVLGGKSFPVLHASGQRLVPAELSADPPACGTSSATAQAYQARKMSQGPVTLGPSIEPMASPWTPPSPKPALERTVPEEKPGQSARPAAVNSGVADGARIPLESNFHAALRPGPRPVGSTWNSGTTQVATAGPPAPGRVPCAPGTADGVRRVSCQPDPDILPAIPRPTPPEAPLAGRPTIPLALPPKTGPVQVAGAARRPQGPIVQASAAQKVNAAPLPRLDLVRLKKRIEVVCGKAARDVQVLAPSPATLLVRVKAVNRAEGQRLPDQIFLLPELEPYQVDLEVKIAH